MRISDWSSDVCSSDLAGWSYEDVLPYFKRAECYEGGEDEIHGGNGPLRVSNARARLELGDMFIEAAENIGIPRTSDFNRGDQTGVGYIQQTTYNGLRCSTAVAYLRPARKRANLATVTNDHVERVIFEGKRAVGVAYSTRKGPRRAVAGREVILSAGAIGSPRT